MRWDRLFDDLEARFAAEADVEAEADLSDLVRAERAGVTVADRLRAHRGVQLSWSLGDQELVAELDDVGAGWVLLAPVAGPGARRLLVPLEAVGAVSGLGRPARQGGEVERRIGLGVVLRRLARDRTPVSVRLAPGAASGALLSGTVDRVGADHLDLAEHALDAPRRAEAVRRVSTVLLHRVLWVEAHT